MQGWGGGAALRLAHTHAARPRLASLSRTLASPATTHPSSTSWLLLKKLPRPLQPALDSPLMPLLPGLLAPAALLQPDGSTDARLQVRRQQGA